MFAQHEGRLPPALALDETRLYKMLITSKYGLVMLLSGMTAASSVSPVYGQRRVAVNLGSSGSKTISGSIQGDKFADYRVPVRAGQSVAVTLRSRSSSVNFNVDPPRSNVSLYIGSINGPRMPARMVPSGGEYVVRVYQMGAAADENKTNRYFLDVRVTGNGLKPLPSSADARLKGTPYHAKASAPCKIALDKSRKNCDAYVIRYGGGSATVEFRAGTLTRRVLFLKGKPAASDSAEAFTHSQNGDMTTVRFGDAPSEEYTVAEALIVGG